MTASNPTLGNPLSAAIVTLPAYYALYALYADYQLNNIAHARLEDLERVRESLRVIAPLIGKDQPYRMDWGLRLFTERQALSTFPPEQVDEAWRQLRDAIEKLGPPLGVPTPRRRLARRGTTPKPPAPPDGPPPKRTKRKFPKSPMDYSREA